MPPLKQVTIARGTPGEDSFRSTIRRHHQRIARHRRHNGGNAPNAPAMSSMGNNKMPLLLRSHSLPTIVVGKDARKRTVSRTDGTKTLATRIRTLGKVSEEFHSSVVGSRSEKAVDNGIIPSSVTRVVGGGEYQSANIDATVQNRPPSVRPATYTETTVPTSASVNRKSIGAPRKRFRSKHRSRRRVIRITMPSTKKQQQRVKGGAKVQKALQTLDKQGLRAVLAKNKLVKASTKAPEALLRHIAAGAF